MASRLFKGRKTSYPASVGEAFEGDHVGLSREEVQAKWKKIEVQARAVDVLFAQHVQKINRSNGHVAQRHLILCPHQLLVSAGLWWGESSACVCVCMCVYM